MNAPSKKRRNTAIRLIRKKASGFREGEWLYLTNCHSSYYGRMQGCYFISEIKKMSDEGRTFILRGVEGKSTHNYAVLEFRFTTELYRLAGEPLGYIIQEDAWVS